MGGSFFFDFDGPPCPMPRRDAERSENEEWLADVSSQIKQRAKMAVENGGVERRRRGKPDWNSRIEATWRRQVYDAKEDRYCPLWRSKRRRRPQTAQGGSFSSAARLSKLPSTVAGSTASSMFPRGSISRGSLRSKSSSSAARPGPPPHCLLQRD